MGQAGPIYLWPSQPDAIPSTRGMADPAHPNWVPHPQQLVLSPLLETNHDSSPEWEGLRRP